MITKKICLSHHYNGSNRFLFVDATKIYQFKARDYGIEPYLLCLGNISKDFAANNLKKIYKIMLGFITKCLLDYQALAE